MFIPDKYKVYMPEPLDPPGRPGSKQHKDAVEDYANKWYDARLKGPYSWSSPTPAKAWNATKERNTILRNFGYRSMLKPGGTKLDYIGVPDKRHRLDFLNKEFRAGMKLKHRVVRRGQEKEGAYRVASMYYKVQGDTAQQTNASRKATEIRKYYESMVERVERRPKKYGKMVLDAKARKARLLADKG